MPRVPLELTRLHRCRLALALGALATLGALAAACGDAQDPTNEVLTITECEELGGTPLFDPDEQRPRELDCPQGLRFMGEFDEDFYGAAGGVCCGDRAASVGATEP
jgi:hypothetical protein